MLGRDLPTTAGRFHGRFIVSWLDRTGPLFLPIKTFPLFSPRVPLIFHVLKLLPFQLSLLPCIASYSLVFTFSLFFTFQELHLISSLMLSLSPNFLLLFIFNLFFSLCLMLSTFPSSFFIVLRCRDPEPEFVNLLRSPGINPSLAGQYDNPIGCTGPPGYIGRLNRFLGIDSWAP